MRGLEVLEVLHRAAPAAGVRHQSEPDFVLSMFMVRRDAVSLSFRAAHSFIEKDPQVPARLIVLRDVRPHGAPPSVRRPRRDGRRPVRHQPHRLLVRLCVARAPNL